MGQALVETGPHKGHTHYECDACSMYFETAKELVDHGAKVHPVQVAAA